MSTATDPHARALALYEAYLPWFEQWFATQYFDDPEQAAHHRILGLHALYEAAHAWVLQPPDTREGHFIDHAQLMIQAAWDKPADALAHPAAHADSLLVQEDLPFADRPMRAHGQLPNAAHLPLPGAVNRPGNYFTHWRNLLFQYWALILSLVVAFECGIAALTLAVPPVYLASTTLNTGMGRRDPLSGGGDWFSQGVQIANITELLKSRTVLQETLQTLHWSLSPDDLQDRITITRLGQAGFLRIDAEAERPADAAALANTLVRVFLQVYASHQSTDARSNHAFFNGQVRVARQRLDRAEGALKAFRQRAVPELQAAVPARVNDLLAQREDATRALAASVAGLASVEEQWRQLQNSPEAKRALIHHGTLDTHLDRIRELENNLKDAREIYGPRSDIVQMLSQQLARARHGLTVARDESDSNRPDFQDTRARLMQLRTDVAMHRARLKTIERSLATWQPQASLAGTQAITIEHLTREVKVAETQYLDLQTQLGQSRLQAQGAQNLPITVIDPATTPAQPTGNKLGLKLALGLPIAVILGLCLAHLLARRRHKPISTHPGNPAHAIIFTRGRP